MSWDPDLSELHKGVFRARLVGGPSSNVVAFSPSCLYRLKSVEISDGWDIEMVTIGNVILTAFRKSPYPLCTPADRITIIAHQFPNVSVPQALLTVIGDVF